MTAVNDNDIFNSKSLPAREQVSEWVNVKKEIGTKVSGIFRGYWTSPSTIDTTKLQISMAIEQPDGTVIGVTLNDSTYTRARIMASQNGDRMGIRYEGDKDTGKAQPAKIVKIYNPDLEARSAKGEVAETHPSVVAASGAEAEAEDESPF